MTATNVSTADAPVPTGQEDFSTFIGQHREKCATCKGREGCPLHRHVESGDEEKLRQIASALLLMEIIEMLIQIVEGPHDGHRSFSR